MPNVQHSVGPDASWLLNNATDQVAGVRVGGRPDALLATFSTDALGNIAGLANPGGAGTITGI